MLIHESPAALPARSALASWSGKSLDLTLFRGRVCRRIAERHADQTDEGAIFGTARALLALGFTADTLLEFRHVGSDIIAASGTVGELAKWTIKERDRSGLRKERWQPYDAEFFFPGDAENGRRRPGLDDRA